MPTANNASITEKFLGAVAQHLLKNGNDLSRYWIVFPNKRAPIMFRRYLKRLCKGMLMMPELTTIGAFNERFATDVVLTDRTELLFVLYNSYKKVLQAQGFEPKTFDAFAWWGNVMLDDFDAIDSSMADAHDLYTNIERYNEIQSNFLTEEQIELLKGIWGDDALAHLTPADSDKAPFWIHTDGIGDAPTQRFMHLWRLTYDIYQQFNDDLATLRLTYPGKLHRQVNSIIRDMSADELPFEKIAFVGFSNVSIATGATMKLLRDRNKALFYWDILPDRSYNTSARRLVSRLARQFKMPDDFNLDLPESMPEVRVISVPSSFMQTKVAGHIIRHWDNEKLINASRSDNTCIMLPDTSLLPAITHALPSGTGKNKMSVNVTMGLSYRDTPFASLLSSIVSMHMRQRSMNGKQSFFHEDVKSVVNNPLLHGILPEACDKVISMLNHDHQFNITADILIKDASELKPLFVNIPDQASLADVKQYIDGVMQLLNSAIERVASNNRHENAALTNEGKILQAYTDGANRIFSCLHTYHITEIGEGRVLGLLEKLLSLFTLNMSGTPLEGLQVMGILETRALDFDNIIILSANERTLPRQTYMRSLIPQAIRRAFGLPMAEDLDTEYAYYFFRLISRARRVVCTYDSRTAGLSSGAMSRYLLQLKLLAPPGFVSFSSLNLPVSASEKRNISVEKTDKVMQQLAGLKDSKDGYNLSASAIKKYLSCPLKFYLGSVRGLSEDDEPKPFMTAAVFGTIIHNTLQDIYTGLRPDPNQTEPVQVTEAALQAMKAKPDLGNRVLRNVDAIYHNGRYQYNIDAMPAESKLLAEMMTDFVEKVLEKDINDIKAGKGFKFWDAEMSLDTIGRFDKPGDGIQWQATAKHSVNVRMDIDRVDIMDDCSLRFIDYKTGRDSNITSSLDDIFNGKNDAIFQLLFYATIFSEKQRNKYPHFAAGKIYPAIYRIAKAYDENGKSDPFTEEGIFLKRDKNDKKERIIWNNPEAVNFDQTAFRARLGQVIDEIFDPEVPFAQTKDSDHCKYCQYNTMCHRTANDDVDDDK